MSLVYQLEAIRLYERTFPAPGRPVMPILMLLPLFLTAEFTIVLARSASDGLLLSMSVMAFARARLSPFMSFCIGHHYSSIFSLIASIVLLAALAMGVPGPNIAATPRS